MNTINVENCKTLLIGRRGENEVTTVAFDFTEWASEFGSGVVDLYVKRFGDDSAYPVVLTIDGTVASWLVTETDTNVAGYGKAEYVYRVDGKIAKSAVFPFFVAEDIGQPASEPPDPYESWLEQLTALGAETEAHAQAAEQSAENAAESAQEAAGSATSAESYAGQAETAAGLAQAAQTASEAARDAAQTAQASAESSATAASGSAASAASSATAAAGSASDASASASAAGASATAASASATTASNAATAAQTAQSAAEDAAEDAQQAAQQAHVEYEQLSGEVDDLSDEVSQQKSAIEAHEQYAEDTYAKQDGSYEDLTAGNAYELLSDRGDTNQQPYLFRQTGGDSSAYNREQLKKIVGGTVAFNQLVPDTPSEEEIEITLEDGHKYLTRINGTDRMVAGSGQSVTAVNGRDNVIDLTQMFGTAIADYLYSLEQSTAGAGVAFFRSLFPADYYDYNPGELMSVEGVSAHETVGFNQWDGAADSIGKSIAADGSLQDSSNYCVSDYIRVLPNTTYYLKNVAPSANARTLFCYGYDKSPITAVGLSGTQNVPASGLVTTVDGTHFVRIVRFASTAEYGINLSDPKRNGTYEPYKKRTYPLDDSLTLRGIPKLDSNNRLYYDGDEYEPDGAVTRKYNFLEFDGSPDESWRLQSINSHGIANFYYAGIPTYASGAYTLNSICNRFFRQTSLISDTTTEGYMFAGGSTLYIRLDSTKANTVEAFRTWLANNPTAFVYMLATPTAETAEPYRELEICDRDGTEEFVSTSIVPVGHETFYPVNVFDYIDRLTEPDADMIADSAIAANKYFSVGNRLFLSTASIAAGAQIIPGTNCQETSLAAALNALNA